MDLDPLACYQALLARDARYDGHFFTCVRSTGIYCRPVCPARPPLLANCLFVPSAAAAQEAGFRPCLRCRPECSPGVGAWLGTSSSVQRALALIEQGALDEGDVQALAERLGMGERHLRRLFQQHVGATPVAVAQTRRVLLAKQLIAQTSLPMTDVALASGFGSIRRFNETFQTLFGRPPSALRRGKPKVWSADAGITLLLSYRPPYDWPAMLGFLKARAIPGVERVDGQRYQRVIELDVPHGRAGGAVQPSVWHKGLLSVSHEPDAHALRVTVHCAALGPLPKIIARVRRVFDLDANPVAIATSLSRDAALAPMVAARPGLRVPGAWDGFEIAVRAVLGQQVTVAAATGLAADLVRRIGTPLAPDDAVARAAGLTHAFPRPGCFDPLKLEGMRMPRARLAAVLGLAQAFAADRHLFDARANLDDAVARLCQLPGIGEWTAQYIAMRVLRESDAFMAADVALQRALVCGDAPRPSAKALLQRAQAWRPWRAYAVMQLWAHDRDRATTSIKESIDATAS